MTYRQWVEDKAAELGSDGCTGVSAVYRWCCLEHDIAYRTAVNRDGTYISKADADERFRSCIQRTSPLGWWSPMAWWRWLAVTWWGTPSAPRVLSLRGETADEARRRIIAEVEAEYTERKVSR